MKGMNMMSTAQETPGSQVGSGDVTVFPSADAHRGTVVTDVKADWYGLGGQEPFRATISLDLDPSRLIAIQCVLDAFADGRDVRIISEPDLVTAVDELLRKRQGGSSQ
jgi:hypothetical protein